MWRQCSRTLLFSPNHLIRHLADGPAAGGGKAHQESEKGKGQGQERDQGRGQEQGKKKKQQASKSKKAKTKRKMFKVRAMQVTLLGADTRLGELASVLLKQNPLVSVLRLQGVGRVKGMAADLNSMDTRCKAVAFAGVERVPDSLKGTDVVLLLGLSDPTRDFSLIDVLMAEGKRLKGLVQHCAEYCPKAVTVVCVPPISVTLPITALLFKKTHWYHPGRIFGFSGYIQMQANTMLAKYQTLDPVSVHVPLLGGPERDTAVPLFCRATPAPLLLRDCPRLLSRFRGLRKGDFPRKVALSYRCERAALAEACSLNRLVTAVCMGANGDDAAVSSAMVRTNAIHICKHFVSEVKFGRHGVIHNYGIPKLSSMALKLVERAALVLKERESLAEEFVRYTDTSDEKEPPFKAKEEAARKRAEAGIAR